MSNVERAEAVAFRAVRRGLWSEELAEAFVEAVEEGRIEDKPDKHLVEERLAARREMLDDRYLRDGRLTNVERFLHMYDGDRDG